MIRIRLRFGFLLLLPAMVAMLMLGRANCERMKARGFSAYGQQAMMNCFSLFIQSPTPSNHVFFQKSTIILYWLVFLFFFHCWLHVRSKGEIHYGHTCVNIIRCLIANWFAPFLFLVRETLTAEAETIANILERKAIEPTLEHQ